MFAFFFTFEFGIRGIEYVLIAESRGMPLPRRKRFTRSFFQPRWEVNWTTSRNKPAINK
jgi:hypothetical protein